VCTHTTNKPNKKAGFSYPKADLSERAISEVRHTVSAPRHTLCYQQRSKTKERRGKEDGCVLHRRSASVSTKLQVLTHNTNKLCRTTQEKAREQKEERSEQKDG